MHIDEQAAELRAQNNGNPAIYEVLKEVAKMSDVPVIFEVRPAKNINDFVSYKHILVSKSTAEVMPFELLLADGETSGVLAKKFIGDYNGYIGSFEHQSNNRVVPDQPLYEELEGAFSRVLSEEKYGGFLEFLEKFNEPSLESLKHVIPHIAMVHPEKTDNGYIGKILVDPKYKGMNQRYPCMALKICNYRLTD